ncbi:MAG: PQQ-binding-like beta-propeller repeat protein [Bryobacterales bacterium]|nr:PQQ-binding-like beta-propeller repeat protein [Bryobacterales bacterium]
MLANLLKPVRHAALPAKRATQFGLGLALAAGIAAGAGPEAKDAWRQWRGPNNNGVAESDAPLTFSATENVKWRIRIPGKGHSTPVISDGRIYLTTAREAGTDTETGALVEHDFLVIAVDMETGREIWRRTAATAEPHEGYHRKYGSYASNSPVTDGETLIASFGSRGVYAYDMDGGLLWKKDIGPMRMRMAFGEGIAPLLHGDSVVLQNDHEGQSYIAVLDKRTGEERWRAERDERSSWPQPIVVNYGGREQLVTSSTRMRSYDLETGELIWEAGGLGPNAIPAVINVNNEMVIAMTGYRDPNLLAIQLGGRGDITDDPEFVKWTNQRGNAYSASPVLHDGILYFVTDRGLVNAFDAVTGEKHYHQQRLPSPYTFKASPVAASGKLYLASEEGDVIVLKLGTEYEVLAVNSMGDEMFVSSPVILDGNLFLRSEDELFCISAN